MRKKSTVRAWGIKWSDGRLSTTTFNDEGAAQNRIKKLNRGATGRPTPKVVPVVITEKSS